eukprot:CAMPEP_0172542628 /NCGR_PEP_ID=MMETSP1067-20121228/13202_1 /TAXON_ID=265564 ORGANISM="Thalassiosira punctigera, Strain Tpunct2005C2" /NCGR_SAMPLE_ID=MMETSP1067 /ASSEMBLY_ACC=CAM_ASM_000444 /LENGTH=44 /DNA_ID= /DNA_START= /DNA_END= /DNA_ORIENTATION=
MVRGSIASQSSDAGGPGGLRWSCTATDAVTSNTDDLVMREFSSL